MNLTESWRQLSECMTPQANASGSAALPDLKTWHALFSDRPRPLLLPAHNRKARRSGVRFFLPQLWHRWYARVRLQAHDLFGSRARLPLLKLSSPTALTDRLDITESPQLAFLIGTPGPYQKASMLVMSLQGEPLALVKIAMGSDASNMVQAEAQWLRALNEHPSMRACVPQLLQEGLTHNARRFCVQSIVEGRPDTGAFTAAHADFLRRLGAIQRTECRFVDAPIYALLQERFVALRPQIEDAQAQLLSAALAECAKRLQDWSGPFVVAHGDFAFWNIRISGDRLAVFDWEYAMAGAPPLFDLLHFHLIAPATSGRLLNERDLRRALAPAKAFALLAYPEHDWSPSAVAGFGLAYLLHTLLFYGISRGALNESHPVIRSYCRLLEERAAWLP